MGLERKGCEKIGEIENSEILICSSEIIRYIGMEKGIAISSQKTKEQIQEIQKYSLDLEYQNEKINWNNILGEDETGSKFLTGIIKDRKKRIDEKIFMADRPPFAIVTIKDEKIIRIEYYEGHDYLVKVFDLRTKELIGKKIKDNYIGG